MLKIAALLAVALLSGCIEQPIPRADGEPLAGYTGCDMDIRRCEPGMRRLGL